MGNRKTKIIATIGPASGDRKTLLKMMKAGVNVARLNFSHGDHKMHEGMLKRVRSASKKSGVSVAIIQDLAGPKIRTGEHGGMVSLQRGSALVLTTKKYAGDTGKLHVNYKNLPKEVEKGNIILLDDGKKKLQVVSVKGTDIRCKVLVGGEIAGRRGVSVPGVSLSINPLTEKDRKDVRFGVKHKVDFMALSFVRKAADVKHLRNLIEKARGNTGIIAKIETPAAVAHIDEIIAEADAIMLARGDLAVEGPPEEVPILQKRIIGKCNRAGKPVIVATQMLESMIRLPVPTRAEVSDVANSILDGADAVMLSAETATGNYPVETVQMMSDVAKKTEEGYPHSRMLGMVSDYTEEGGNVGTSDAITHYVVNTAHDIGAEIIVALTESGSTARMVSRYRPRQPIVVMSPNKRVLGRIILSFGCYPYEIKSFTYVGEATERMRAILKKEKFAKRGDKFVLAAGVPFGRTGRTNMVMVLKV